MELVSTNSELGASFGVYPRFITVPPPSAGTKTWSGAGADDNWSTASNWVEGVAPSPGDAILFKDGTRTTSNNDLSAGATYTSITYDTDADAVTITGNALTLTGNITNNSSNAQIINVAITINAASWTVATGAQNMTISGVIAETGARSLTKTGAGILTLTGANTYTGTTTISAGTIKTADAAFSTTPRTWTISSGATLNVDGNTGVATGTTTINGDGTLSVTGGTWVNNAGTGRVVNINLTTNGFVHITSGAAITSGLSGAFDWITNNARLQLDGTLTGTNTDAIRFGPISGAGPIGKTLSGTVTLTLGVGVWSGSFEYSGTLDESAGNLSVGFNATNSTCTQIISGTFNPNARINAYGGTLRINGTVSNNNSLVINAGARVDGTGTINRLITVNNNALASLAGGVGGAETLNTASVTFNGTSSRLKVTTNGTTGVSLIASSGTVTLNGATVDFDPTQNLNAGTYTLISAASMVGTATQGTLPIGRTWTSLSVVGNDLVAVLG